MVTFFLSDMNIDWFSKKISIRLISMVSGYNLTYCRLFLNLTRISVNNSPVLITVPVRCSGHNLTTLT